SPRKPTSVWSAVNVNRVLALSKNGLMRPAGVAAYEKRREKRSGIYSYEQRTDTLPEPYARQMKTNKSAWDFFQAQIPSYSKAVSWWVVSAKKEETRQNRLRQLIEDSTRGRMIGQFTRLQKSKQGS